jgi:hypothetical protein
MFRTLKTLVLFLTCAVPAFGQTASTGDVVQPGKVNNICSVDGLAHAGLTGINSCNSLFTITSPGITWIPSNAPKTALWNAPPNGALLLDTRYVNGTGFLEQTPGPGRNAEFSHMHLDFHAGANEAFETANTNSGQVGLSIEGFADAGGVANHNQKANLVTLFVSCQRETGSIRPVWCVNTSTNYHSDTSRGATTRGWEVDLNNSGKADDTGGIGIGVQIISGGGANGKKAGTGLAINNTSGPGGNDSWERGAIISNYVLTGLYLLAGSHRTADLYIVPPADDTAPSIRLRNSADTADVFKIDDRGNLTTKGLIQGAFFASPSSGGIATDGIVRLANTDNLCWRNNASNANICFGKDTSDHFVGNNIPIVTSFTTTADKTDKVTVTGMAAGGHCSLTATNAGAAAGIASVYISHKTTNQITVTHAATSGWTFDVMCTPN